MIVSAVADPTAFGPNGVNDKLTKREAVSFLQGILDNGVLIDEPTRALLRQAATEALQLSTKLGQDIQMLLGEILKQHKKFVVLCDKHSWNKASSATLSAQCGFLANHLAADAVLTTGQNQQAISQIVTNSEVILVEDCSDSNYEATRRRIARVESPLDELKLHEIEEIVGRATKYCNVIRFFDFRMVGSKGNAKHYCAGILFFVQIWERNCVVGDPASRRVELYTVGEFTSLGGFLSGADADQRLEQLIQNPLNAAIKAQVSRFVKKDVEPKVFHQRGFVSKKRAFTIDPGFDAVRTNGPVKRCILSCCLAAEKHFEDCRKLADLP